MSINQTNSLAELASKKARHTRQYKQPITGCISAACTNGKCGQCWMLKCTHSCHKRVQRETGNMPLKLLPNTRETVVSTLPKMKVTVVEHTPPPQPQSEVKPPSPLSPTMPIEGLGKPQDASPEAGGSLATPPNGDSSTVWSQVAKDLENRSNYLPIAVSGVLSAPVSATDLYGLTLDLPVAFKRFLLEYQNLQQDYKSLYDGMGKAVGALINNEDFTHNFRYAAGLEAQKILESVSKPK